MGGFSFHNDLHELARSPWAAACKDVHGIYDLQVVAGQPGNGKQSWPEGLAGMVERVLRKPLCKAEQRSYWHRRPLRAAQRHYAALDAYVLLQVASQLVGIPLSDPARLAARLRAQNRIQ